MYKPHRIGPSRVQAIREMDSDEVMRQILIILEDCDLPIMSMDVRAASESARRTEDEVTLFLQGLKPKSQATPKLNGEVLNTAVEALKKFLRGQVAIGNFGQLHRKVLVEYVQGQTGLKSDQWFSIATKKLIDEGMLERVGKPQAQQFRAVAREQEDSAPELRVAGAEG